MNVLHKDLLSFVNQIRHLKRFASVNTHAVVKITKKYDKHAAAPILTKVMESLEDFNFYSSARFNKLENSTEELLLRIEGRIPARHDLSTPHAAFTADSYPDPMPQLADASPASSPTLSALISPRTPILPPLKYTSDQLGAATSRSASVGLECLAIVAIEALSQQKLDAASSQQVLHDSSADSQVAHKPAVRDGTTFLSGGASVAGSSGAADSRRGTKRKASCSPGPHCDSSSSSSRSASEAPASGQRCKNAGVLEVKPRLRRRSYGEGGRQALGGRPHHDEETTIAPIQVTADVLRQHFAMPLNDAARHIGICATAIKRACRKMGIREWPFQRIKPIERRLAKLKAQTQTAPGVSQEVEMLEAKVQALLRGEKVDEEEDNSEMSSRKR